MACTHIMMICNKCGTVYDQDFHPPAMCHNGATDWDVFESHRTECRIHRNQDERRVFRNGDFNVADKSR